MEMSVDRFGGLRALLLMLVGVVGLGAGVREAIAFTNGGCVSGLYTMPNGVQGFYCGNGTCNATGGCQIAGGPGGGGTSGSYSCICALVFAETCGRNVSWSISGGVLSVTDNGCLGPCTVQGQTCQEKPPYTDPEPPMGTISGCECR